MAGSDGANGAAVAEPTPATANTAKLAAPIKVIFMCRSFSGRSMIEGPTRVDVKVTLPGWNVNAWHPVNPSLPILVPVLTRANASGL